MINCGNSSDEFVKKEEMTPIEELVSNATNLLGVTNSRSFLN